MNAGGNAAARLAQAERDVEAFHQIFLAQYDKYVRAAEARGLRVYDQLPKVKLINGNIEFHAEHRIFLRFCPHETRDNGHWYRRENVNVDSFGVYDFQDTEGGYREYFEISQEADAIDGKFKYMIEDRNDFINKIKSSENGSCNEGRLDVAFQNFIDLIENKSRFVIENRKQDFFEKEQIEISKIESELIEKTMK
jgi:hypothetical protein